MDGPLQIGCKRVLVSQTQVIVVRADHDVFGRGPREKTGDVMHRLVHVSQIDVQIDLEFGQLKGSRREVAVDAGGELAQVAALGAKPLFGRRFLDLYKKDAGIARTT